MFYVPNTKLMIVCERILIIFYLNVNNYYFSREIKETCLTSTSLTNNKLHLLIRN